MAKRSAVRDRIRASACYTRALFSALPSLGRARGERIVLEGEPGSPLAPPPGCPFHPRCPIAREVCRTVEPRELDLASHRVSCHAVEEELMARKPDGQG